MKLSDDRIGYLAHRIADALAEDDRVAFRRPWDEVKQVVRTAITRAMQQDAAAEERARGKIASLGRAVPEGSAEFDALFRSYYDEELARLRSIH